MTMTITLYSDADDRVVGVVYDDSQGDSDYFGYVVKEGVATSVTTDPGAMRTAMRGRAVKKVVYVDQGPVQNVSNMDVNMIAERGDEYMRESGWKSMSIPTEKI